MDQYVQENVVSIFSVLGNVRREIEQGRSQHQPNTLSTITTSTSHTSSINHGSDSSSSILVNDQPASASQTTHEVRTEYVESSEEESALQHRTSRSAMQQQQQQHEDASQSQANK